MPIQDLPKDIDPTVVRSKLAQSRKNAEALDRARDELLRDHEGQWVASYDGKFIFGDSLEKALDAAKSEGWPLDVVAIQHLMSERPVILL